MGHYASEMDGSPGRPNHDIIVECKCGWRGRQSKLVHDKETGEKHCPLCHAPFNKWPQDVAKLYSR